MMKKATILKMFKKQQYRSFSKRLTRRIGLHWRWH